MRPFFPTGGDAAPGVLRLDVARIGAALRDADNADGRDGSGDVHRDETRRLIEGYAYIDELLGTGVDLFAYGGSGLVLEVNHRVLCGSSPATRAEAAAHIADTRAHFYEVRPGAFGEVADWYALHRDREGHSLAAGCYVQVVRSPQLFLEGNQRSAALIASWLLARHGLPPLVRTAGNAAALDRLSAGIKTLGRSSLLHDLLAVLAERRLRRFLVAQADWRFVVTAPEAAAPPLTPRGRRGRNCRGRV